MKKYFKKMVAMTAAVMLLATSSYAAFVDMPADEREQAALEKAVSNGLLNGVGEDMIAPYQSITRSQMGAILARAMGAKKTAKIDNFTDVSKDAWYYEEMAKAVYMGAFEGDGGSNLYPDKEITYQEAFLVLSRVFDLRYVKEGCLDGYADKNLVASWAEEGVAKIVSGGYYEGSTLNPTAPISRVEFAKLMDNLVAIYIDKPGTYAGLGRGNALVRVDGVVIEGGVSTAKNTVTEGGLVIVGDGVSSCEFKDSKGVNVVARGGNIKLSGEFGIVKAVMSGVVLVPDQNNLTVANYPDGTKGVVSAEADGSYIILESVTIE